MNTLIAPLSVAICCCVLGVCVRSITRDHRTIWVETLAIVLSSTLIVLIYLNIPVTQHISDYLYFFIGLSLLGIIFPLYRMLEISISVQRRQQIKDFIAGIPLMIKTILSGLFARLINTE
jgi:hypothetical protein